VCGLRGQQDTTQPVQSVGEWKLLEGNAKLMAWLPAPKGQRSLRRVCLYGVWVLITLTGIHNTVGSTLQTLQITS
jgi:hypothetical protein